MTSESRMNNREVIEAVRALYANGFYRAMPVAAARIERECVERQDAFLEETGRLYVADAEDIFERGVGVLGSLVRPTIERFGMHLGALDSTCDASGDVIVVHDGRSIARISKDWGITLSPWTRMLAVAAASTNNVLMQLGTDERLYFGSAQNDTVCVLLGSAMQSALVGTVWGARQSLKAAKFVHDSDEGAEEVASNCRSECMFVRSEHMS